MRVELDAARASAAANSAPGTPDLLRLVPAVPSPRTGPAPRHPRLPRAERKEAERSERLARVELALAAPLGEWVRRSCAIHRAPVDWPSVLTVTYLAAIDYFNALGIAVKQLEVETIRRDLERPGRLTTPEWLVGRAMRSAALAALVPAPVRPSHSLAVPLAGACGIQWRCLPVGHPRRDRLEATAASLAEHGASVPMIRRAAVQWHRERSTTKWLSWEELLSDFDGLLERADRFDAIRRATGLADDNRSLRRFAREIKRSGIDPSRIIRSAEDVRRRAGRRVSLGELVGEIDEAFGAHQSVLDYRGIDVSRRVESPLSNWLLPEPPSGAPKVSDAPDAPDA
jgi:hypothetical protein